MKLVAIGAMLVEHWQRVVVDPSHLWPYIVGRLAFPLFAAVVAYNAVHRSANPKRFAGRLAVWGCVAQLPWLLAFGPAPGAALNVLFTLAAGVMLVAWSRADSGRVVVAMAGLVCIAGVERVVGWSVVEFGAWGVGAIVAAGWALSTMGATRRGAWCCFVLCVALANLPALSALYLVLAAVASVACAAVWLLRDVSAWRVPQVVGYAVYPAHLGVLWLVAWFGG